MKAAAHGKFVSGAKVLAAVPSIPQSRRVYRELYENEDRLETGGESSCQQRLKYRILEECFSRIENRNFGSRTKSPGQNSPGQNPPDKIPLGQNPPGQNPPHYIPPNSSIAQYFLLYINVIFEGQFFKPLLDVIYSMMMKWRSVAERSR